MDKYYLQYMYEQILEIPTKHALKNNQDKHNEY